MKPLVTASWTLLSHSCLRNCSWPYIESSLHVFLLTTCTAIASMLLRHTMCRDSFSMAKVFSTYAMLFLVGFLPTFGPAWVNIYGSFREYKAYDKYSYLDEGTVSPSLFLMYSVYVCFDVRVLIAMLVTILSCLTTS